MRSLRCHPAKRPSRARQTGMISMRSFGAAEATDRAESTETSCSALTPPKMRTVRIMSRGGPVSCVLSPASPKHTGRGTQDSGLLLFRDRHAAQQILQIIVAPPDPAADRKRRVVEDVVDTGGEEQHRRVRFLLAEDVFAIEAHVRIAVTALAEIEGLAGEPKAIGQPVIDARASRRVEQTDADGEGLQVPSRLGRDEETTIERRLVVDDGQGASRRRVGERVL